MIKKITIYFIFAAALLCTSASYAGVNVIGRVTDDKSQPMVGVTISDRELNK